MIFFVVIIFVSLLFTEGEFSGFETREEIEHCLKRAAIQTAVVIGVILFLSWLGSK